MSALPEKGPTPAYGSFKTFTSFVNEMRDAGHVPLRVDRSLMTKLSGSAATETIATLRFLSLITDSGEPTDSFEQYVMASDDDRKSVMAQILRKAYPFLFNKPGFDVGRASGGQVSELFRESGNLSGSTLSRAISFFLAAAKEGGVTVSPNVRPPQASRVAGSKPKKEKEARREPLPPADPLVRENVDPDTVHRFELPIPGKPSVVVLIPKSLDGDDWDMFQQMFSIYVSRWKGFKEAKSDAASKKEVPE